MDEKNQSKEIETKEAQDTKKIAIVRITGKVKLKKKIKSTLAMLNLPKKNSCVIIPATPSYLGMIKKLKDVITWGDIDDETLNLLKEKRSKENQKFFTLHPPIGGYGKKGTKMPFKLGGALGPRKEKINDFIKKML